MQVHKEELELGVRLGGGGPPAAVQPVGRQLAILHRECALERLCRRLRLHVVRAPQQRLQRPYKFIEDPSARVMDTARLLLAPVNKWSVSGAIATVHESVEGFMTGKSQLTGKFCV